jgi:hypothetical protein
VGGVMRTQAELERANPRNLRRYGLASAEEYFARQATQKVSPQHQTLSFYPKP